MKKFSTGTWFAVMTVFAFASVISFFHINSYVADKHKLNGLVGFLGLGIVFGLVAIYCLWQVSKAGSSRDSGV